MSHEVIKSVRGREYRYEVQSYRDPASGKVRGRWKYLGRVGSGATQIRRPASSATATRERLLDALATLLDRHEFSELTVSQIAAEAGLAHGTFYRYFSDKNAALSAAALRIREEVERSRPDLEVQAESPAAERERIRDWVVTILRAPVGRPGLLREWYAALARDPALKAERARRQADLRAAFAGYLQRLGDAGSISLARPAELADALLTAIDGAIRGLALDQKPFPERTITGFADLFERAIFGLSV